MLGEAQGLGTSGVHNVGVDRGGGAGKVVEGLGHPGVGAAELGVGDEEPRLGVLGVGLADDCGEVAVEHVVRPPTPHHVPTCTLTPRGWPKGGDRGRGRPSPRPVFSSTLRSSKAFKFERLT